MDKRHTPGPWWAGRETIKGDSVIFSEETESILATIHEDNNTYLIANAPDMYELLERVQKAITEYCKRFTYTHSPVTESDLQRLAEEITQLQEQIDGTRLIPVKSKE